MTLEEKVGRHFLIGIPGKVSDRETKELLEEIRPGSVILFGRNVDNPRQVRKLIDDISSLLGYKPLISIDQEGGIVTRLIDGFSVSPGAMAIAATNDPSNARRAAEIMADEMKAVGIDWDLAPVVDINGPENPVIGVRSFGGEPGLVIQYAREFVEGLTERGVIACLKHFPGLGRAAVDPHLDLPEIDLNVEELKKRELRPFLEIDAASWMPTHLYMPCVQKVRIPVTLDPYILTDVVRGELKYTGVLVADDLLMGGISNYYSPEEAVVKSFAAGMDVVSLCHKPEVQKAAKKHFVESLKRSQFLMKRLDESLDRVERLFDLVGAVDTPSMDLVGREDNIFFMRTIADKSITLVRNEDNMLPLHRVDTVVTIKPSRLVQIEEPGSGVLEIAASLADTFECPIVEYLHGQKDFRHIIDRVAGKTIILFTENAHLKSSEVDFVKKLRSAAGKLLVVALRNPYDALIEGVRNSITSYNYTSSSQYSLLEVILGRRPATGSFPIKNE